MQIFSIISFLNDSKFYDEQRNKLSKCHLSSDFQLAQAFGSSPVTASRPAVLAVTGSRPAVLAVTGSRPAVLAQRLGPIQLALNL